MHTVIILATLILFQPSQFSIRGHFRLSDSSCVDLSNVTCSFRYAETPSRRCNASTQSPVAM
ncbi:hypothetical protein M758_3G076000 [Ceratodon purpureus]|nr:hypothetical protein M758_3G076000 [Ceratodon purpureus]